MSNRIRTANWSLIAWVALGAAPVTAQLHTEVVTNITSPPGVPSGAIIGGISDFYYAVPGFNNSGKVAFLGKMIAGFSGVTTSTESGLWSNGRGSLQLVAREGSQAPGAAAGAVFSDFTRDPHLNDRGDVAFMGRLRTGEGGVTSATSEGVWSQRNGQLNLVALSGQTAPGAPAGATFVDMLGLSYSGALFAFNNSGQTAFTSLLTLGAGGVTNDNNSGIWSDPGGVLTAVAIEGTQAPGAPAGALFDDFSSPTDTAHLNHAGQVAFMANLRVGLGGVTSNNNWGVWSGKPGAINLVAREGTSAPGVSGGVFEGFGTPAINDAGALVFRGFMRQGFGGVTAANEDGLWTNRNGTLELLAREDSQVEGANQFTLYNSFLYYAVNNQGKVASYVDFKVSFGDVTQANNEAIVAESTSGLQIVAREGDAPPGLFSGEEFASFSPPSINAAGQVAFIGSLKSGVGGVTAGNDTGIWAQDVFGNLQLIVREGDSIQTRPGDFRAITHLQFNANGGNADGMQSLFNDQGVLAFWTQASWQGIYTSDQVKSPYDGADFDENLLVTTEDLAQWKAGAGKAYGALHAQGDADYDGDVDGADFLLWQRQIGDGGAAAVAHRVPEPSGLLMTAACAVATWRRRRTPWHLPLQ